MILSIITVTLNAADHLSDLAKSIRAQGALDGVEWIVIDGASTDSTVDVIKQNADVVSRWISEPDCGLYHAINKAIGMARGEYYVVLGADDRFDPGALRRITSELKASPETDAWCFSVRRRGNILHGRAVTPLRKTVGWMKFISSHSVGTVFRTGLHQRFGMYSLRYPVLADGHFMMKLVESGIQFRNVACCAGEFAEGGATSVDRARLAAETWLIQVHLGRNLFVQTVLFLFRVARLSLQGVARGTRT